MGNATSTTHHDDDGRAAADEAETEETQRRRSHHTAGQINRVATTTSNKYNDCAGGNIGDVNNVQEKHGDGAGRCVVVGVGAGGGGRSDGHSGGHSSHQDGGDDEDWALLNESVFVESETAANGKFTGVLAAAMVEINQSRLDQLLVTGGQLWHSGKRDFVHPHAISKVDDLSWKYFVGYSVFNWRLEAMMGAGWKPKCISCGSNSDVVINSRSRTPRLVYGIKSNYLLNSPEQWRCDSCRRTNATEKANNVEADKRTQYTFSSHHPDVLEALSKENPGIASLFPCELGWRSALDKDLVDLITSAANSGMGPSSIQEYVKTSHYRNHQEAELRWLQFLETRRRTPTISDGCNVADTIKQLKPFPSYASDAVCGRLPSKSLLCDFYCRITHKRTPRMDALHQRLVSTSKIFCIDASYKVPKWLALIFGEQMFSTLITMVDEDHIPLASYFAVSDNHDEIKSALEILQQLGWNPTCGFTDNVPRDKDFLLGNVKSLSTVNAGEDPTMGLIDHHDVIANLTDHHDDAIVTLHNDTNLLQLRSQPQYCASTESAITALNLFEEKIQQSHQKKVVSFDMEWSVYFDGTAPSETAIVGFGSLCHDRIIMIHLAKIKSKVEVLNRIGSILRNKDYLFVGFSIAGDLAKLRKDFPNVNFGVPDLQDLGWWCVYRGLLEHTKGGHTLDNACKVILKKTVPKMAHLRQSDVWTRPGPLGGDAQLYLARDVEGGIQIFDQTKDLPDLSVRLKRQDLQVGMEVDLLPTRKTVVTPIAKGVVVQIGSRNSRTLTGIPLTENRALVEITRVYKPNSGLYYTQVGCRKCKCGAMNHRHGTSTQRCDLRTFGDAVLLKQDPFTIVEECCRMRKSYNIDQEVEVIEQERQPALLMAVPKMSTLRNDGDNESGNLLGDDLCELTFMETETTNEHIAINLPPQAIYELDQLLEYQEENDLSPTSQGDVEEGCEDIFAGASSRQLAVAYEMQASVTRIINDASTLAMLQKDHNLSPRQSKEQQVILGDAFHFMDRVKVPVHHDWKAAYFSAFRDALFIYDTDDKQKVEVVLESMGKTWEREAAFNTRYITKRVRRYIPPSDVLHARVKAVFDFFQDKQDAKTGKKLFSGKDAMKKKDLVLEALLRGELSDPPDIPLYIPEFHPGTNHPRQDKDGLHLWRCIRGTGPAENAHSQYTRAFGQVRAGPMYSCAVLRNHHHRKTIRAAMAHRPGFPQIYHFDSELVDIVDQLSFDLFGKPKYKNWPGYHEAVPTKRSPFGIIPLVEECGRGKRSTPCEYLSPQLRFLASCMDSDIPYTPIATREERILFKKLLEGAINDGMPLNSNTFSILAKKWNHEYVNIPTNPHEATCKIFPKYSRHLTIAYKLWRTRTSKTNRIKEARESDILSALKLNPGIRVPGVRQPKIPTQAIEQEEQEEPRSKRLRNQGQKPLPPDTPILLPQFIPPQFTQAPSPRLTSVPRPPRILPPSAPAYFPSQTFFHLNHQPPRNQQRRSKICTECQKQVCMRPWNRTGKCNL
jgi:hypothetical protein